MKHVFISPHPDDIALSCGGLVARLCADGEAVTIVTVFCGPGSLPHLTPYQRLALGFGSKHRAGAGADEIALRSIESAPEDVVPTPAEAMGVRKAEDWAYAKFIGAQMIHIDRPDAVFRGYEGGEQLLGAPRADDEPPVEDLRRALADLAPDRLYLPMSIGGHVDHRQTRRTVSALLCEPGSPYLGIARLYEDFPYVLTSRFLGLHQLDPDVMACLPAGVALSPEYVEVAAVQERKLDALRSYASQLGRLFGGDDSMSADVRARAALVGESGGVGPAERYWQITSGESIQE